MPATDSAVRIVRAALATLEDKLPDVIAGYNAEDDNVVKLTEPGTYEFGAMDPLIIGAPVVEVAAVTGSFGEWAIDRTEVDHDAQAVVVIWHEGEKGELAPTYEMSLGLRHCVITALRADGAFGDAVEIANDPGSVTWRTEVLPADPTGEGEAREFRKWRCPVLITFRLETVERF